MLSTLRLRSLLDGLSTFRFCPAAFAKVLRVEEDNASTSL
jgi:hypothetical protein